MKNHIVGDGERIKVSFAMADAAIRDDDHGQAAYEKRTADAWKKDPALVPFVPDPCRAYAAGDLRGGGPPRLGR